MIWWRCREMNYQFYCHSFLESSFGMLEASESSESYNLFPHWLTLSRKIQCCTRTIDSEKSCLCFLKNLAKNFLKAVTGRRPIFTYKSHHDQVPSTAFYSRVRCRHPCAPSDHPSRQLVRFRDHANSVSNVPTGEKWQYCQVQWATVSLWVGILPAF